MNLTDEEIRIKVAEAQEWRDLKTTWEGYHQWMHPDGRVRYGTKTCKAACLPNYPEDLNACAEFEKTLTREEWFHYNCCLFKTLVPFEEGDCWDADNARHCVSATARQRCLAFLKTKGLIP